MGAEEYLERLEGKIRKCLFFYVKIFKNNSVVRELCANSISECKSCCLSLKYVSYLQK